jgi:DNA repair protein RecO (recombination protein O)
MTSQNAFLLSFLKYGENDAILHCFTEEDGFQSYFLRGIYTQKNKKRAFLLPLNHLFFSVKTAKSGSMQTISRFETLSVQDFYSDIKINTVVFFVADFLHQILKDENKNLLIFENIEEFSEQLNQKNYRAHLIFLIKILMINGVAPLPGNGDFLDPETGTFRTSKVHPLFNVEISLLWKTIISENGNYSITIPQKIRRDFLDSLMVYYHYHVPEFKTPVSLEVIQQIFE